MKNKKGFTLIELLAVIVLLAVISLVATPIIINMVTKAKRSAAIDSAMGYIEAIEYNNGLGNLNTTAYERLDNGIYDVNEVDIICKGELPSEGTFEIYKLKVKNATLCFNNYRVYYDGHEASIIGGCTERDKEVYKEKILNGADPVLKDDMVPIRISNDGAVRKADIHSKWYSYKDKKWANVVALAGEDTYSEGDIIPDSAIRAYYVWIPRYKYQLFNSNKPVEIKIEFENNKTTKSEEKIIGKYYTHPAFTYGDEELNGFWVGKFETGGAKISPLVKPNIPALTNQNISEQYITSRNVSIDSRVIKNDEWGAVAYLSHSTYGIKNDVRINNNAGFRTGCGALKDDASKSTECEITYGESRFYPQSTTGNIYGIFDMSGGALEYVMAVLADDTGKPYSGRHNVHNSGFNGKFGDVESAKLVSGGDDKITSLTTGINFPSAENYNLYDYPSNRSNITANNGCNGKCYGQALLETKNWYDDLYYFPTNEYPWIFRGGYHDNNSTAGIFGIDNYDGHGVNRIGFRVVTK